MKTHLFLQGPIRSGKSTIIQRAVYPYMDRIGGYFIQRLYLTRDPRRYVGFAIKPIRSCKYSPLDCQVEDLAQVEGLFLFSNARGEWQQVPRVFTRRAVKFLTEANTLGKELLVMDEVGGLEITDRSFFECLAYLLDRDTPILGVLKTQASLDKLRKASKDRSHQIFEDVRKKHSKIQCHDKVRFVTLGEDKTSKVRSIVEDYVKEVFNHGADEALDRGRN